MISEALDRTAALAERVASWPHEGRAQYRPAHKGLRAILKLLYSIAAHIETMSGAVLDRACGEYYTPKRAHLHRAHPNNADIELTCRKPISASHLKLTSQFDVAAS